MGRGRKQRAGNHFMKQLLAILTLAWVWNASGGIPYTLAFTNSKTLYVDPKGLDATAVRGVASQPWRDVYLASANAIAGDVIFINPGSNYASKAILCPSGGAITGVGLGSKLYISDNLVIDGPGIILQDNCLVNNLDVYSDTAIGSYNDVAQNPGATNWVISNCRFQGLTSRYSGIDGLVLTTDLVQSGDVFGCQFFSGYDTVAIRGNFGNPNHKVRFFGCYLRPVTANSGNPARAVSMGQLGAGASVELYGCKLEVDRSAGSGACIGINTEGGVLAGAAILLSAVVETNLLTTDINLADPVTMTLLGGNLGSKGLVNSGGATVNWGAMAGLSYSNYTVAATARTMNTWSGKVKLASGSQTYLVSDTLISNTALVMATVNTTNATAVSCQAFPGSGVVSLKLNAAATADCDITWWLIQQ